MAKCTEWIEIAAWVSHARQWEKPASAKPEFQLGPPARLKDLARKAKYEVSALAGYFGICERTLERHMTAVYKQTPSSWLRTLQVLDSVPLL